MFQLMHERREYFPSAKTLNALNMNTFNCVFRRVFFFFDAQHLTTFRSAKCFVHSSQFHCHHNNIIERKVTILCDNFTMVYFRTNTLLCTLLKQFLPFRIIHMQLDFQWATLLLNKKKKRNRNGWNVAT